MLNGGERIEERDRHLIQLIKEAEKRAAERKWAEKDPIGSCFDSGNSCFNPETFKKDLRLAYFLQEVHPECRELIRGRFKTWPFTIIDKLFWKLLFGYLKPFFQRQTGFNVVSVRTLGQISCLLEEINSSQKNIGSETSQEIINEMKQEIENNKKKIASLEKLLGKETNPPGDKEDG